MKPYIAWAKQYRTKKEEKSGLAGWMLKIFEGIADELEDVMKENVKFNDFDKAQMFLGYLATLPSSNKNGGQQQ
jgi:hypothetical protein